MKRIFAILLAGLLGLGALTACGTADSDQTPGSGETTQNNSSQNGQASGNTGSSMGGTNGTGGDSSITDPGSAITDDGDITGGAMEDTLQDGKTLTDHGSASDPADDPAAGDGISGRASANSSAAGSDAPLFRGASFDQMVRNGLVHDRDGDLRDHENAVTPGLKT